MPVSVDKREFGQMRVSPSEFVSTPPALDFSAHSVA